MSFDYEKFTYFSYLLHVLALNSMLHEFCHFMETYLHISHQFTGFTYFNQIAFITNISMSFKPSDAKSTFWMNILLIPLAFFCPLLIV